MALPIRAIYEHGVLRLLDPVSLSEGQEIQLLIVSEREEAKAILGDLLVHFPDPTYETDKPFDEAALLREIAEGFRGTSLSDAIIQERNEGL